VFPYHPGLLFYREGPVILEALGKLESDVNVLVLPSHGLAHPRRCGLACHVGLAFDRPAVGCARKILAGEYRPVELARGSFQPIRMRGQDVGVAYRSKDNVKPIFISPGHKCDLAFSRDIIVRCLRGFRFPEPLRVAHLLANKHKRNVEKAVRNNG
jgi:deoxyribonuclease V